MHNRYKYIISVIALFLVPFLIMSRHFIYGNKEIHKNYTLRYLEMRTHASSRMVSEALNSRYSMAPLAADKKFRSGSTAERKKILEGKVNESPGIYSELVLLGASGKEVAKASAQKTSAGKFDYSKTEVFAAAQKNSMPFGAVEYGEYTPPALIMAEPVGTGGGKPELFVAGRLSLAYLGELVRRIGNNSHGNMGLLDAGGQVIADSARMSAVKPGSKVPNEIAGVLSSAMTRELFNLSSEVKSGKRNYLVAVSNVPGSLWWIYEVVDVDRMPVYKAPSRAYKRVIAGVVLIFIFGFLSYRLALRWLVNPVDGEDEP